MELVLSRDLFRVYRGQVLTGRLRFGDSVVGRSLGDLVEYQLRVDAAHYRSNDVAERLQSGRRLVLVVIIERLLIFSEPFVEKMDFPMHTCVSQQRCVMCHTVNDELCWRCVPASWIYALYYIRAWNIKGVEYQGLSIEAKSVRRILKWGSVR